jgi:diguanylate cyclase (GGDEF)-like protein/PAS domain S-box-containing protein
VAVAETESPVPEPPVAPGEGAIGLAFEAGLPVVVTDYQTWEHALPASAARGMVAAIAVPLIAGDRPIGALGVWTYQARAFTAEEEQLLTLFAAQVAPALEAAHLNQQRDANARVFKALHEMAVATGGMREPGEVAQLCVDRASRLVQADAALLLWFDAESGLLRTLADSLPGSVAGLDVRPGDGAAGVAFKTRQAVAVSEPAVSDDRLPGLARMRAMLSVPLLVGDEALGVLAVLSSAPREFLPAEIEVLRLLASQIAPALEAARLLESSNLQVRELRTLHDIAVAAGGMLEPRRLAALVVEEACNLLGADRALLRVYEPTSRQLEPLADSAVGAAPAPAATVGAGLAGTVFEAGRAMSVEDYQEWPSSTSWGRAQGFASVVTVPLISHQRPIGTLTAFAAHRRRFTESDIRVLSLLAGQVTPAIEAARLHADLAASERALRAIYDTTPVAIARIDLSGKMLWLNRSGRELFGYGEEEVLALGPEALLADEDRRLDRGLLDELVRGKRDRFRVERRLVKKDGSRFWGDMTVSLVRGADGKPDFYFAMVEDVTERKAAEAARRESEGRFRAVFDRAAIGIARVNLQGRIIEANPTLTRILDQPDDSLDGVAIVDLIHPDDRGTLKLERLASGEASEHQTELRYLRVSGETRWGNTIASVVRDEEGRPLFLILMVEDITHRKAHEAALEFRALHDALTKLPNRSLLYDRLQVAILGARREKRGGAVMLVDLDGFKQVNDVYGHHAGDQVLKQIGERMRAQLRGSDTVARLGGDEFSVVLPNVTGKGALRTAIKLATALSEPFEVGAREAVVSASIGVSLFPHNGDDPELLMRQADAAMYAAKRSRSGCALYDPERDRID